MELNCQEQNIRNFSIIAHIDHGKSTLADRFLELTGTVEKRKMREQYLDQMELEREKGITIKMQPVRMVYSLRSADYVLNLIDTPGHIDFSYEVSRSLKAVEGAILLVDATQGVQAQTIANLEMARVLGMVIIPVVNKIDSPYARTEEVKEEMVNILRFKKEDILDISAKTGQNVSALLEEIIRRVPSPAPSLPTAGTSEGLRALVFDFEYSLHRGVILYTRVIDGQVKKGDKVLLYQADIGFSVAEAGIFTPDKEPRDVLKNGEIGYIITNIKKANIARVGDTLMLKNNLLPALEGYKRPEPVVWASIYPESQDDFSALKQALERLNLQDSALSFEEEGSPRSGGAGSGSSARLDSTQARLAGGLGRGFRCGFLGMLHLEITVERLRREFGLKLITAMPTVVYRVETLKNGAEEVYSPSLFPEYYDIKNISEPWVEVSIITPHGKLNDVIQILKKHDGEIGDTAEFGETRLMLKSRMPLREMMKNFFEELKSATEGYASLNYNLIGWRLADLVRLDVLLNDEPAPAFSRIIKRSEMQREAENVAEKLKELLPRALFAIRIQVKCLGRILAARSVTALKKDVTGYLYGGDRTRKMKLWQKQKRGKEKLKKMGTVDVPHEVFLKMIQSRE